MHLDVSTPQGPELHLDVSGQQEPILSWTCLHHRGLSCTMDLYTLQRPVMHLGVSTPQGFELHMDLSTPKGS